MNNFNKLKDLIASIEGDADKFYNKGIGAAGTRVRKGLQDIKTLASEMRKEVTDLKNSEVIV
ncbi:MAG TPA: histone H1 [Pedobacter sp.]